MLNILSKGTRTRTEVQEQKYIGMYFKVRAFAKEGEVCFEDVLEATNTQNGADAFRALFNAYVQGQK